MKYVGYFDVDNEENRNVALSAKNKMNYIIKALAEIGEKVEVVSISETKGALTHKGKYVQLDKNSTLKTFRTIGQKNRVVGFLDRKLIRLQFLLYMLKHTKRSETVIVYHSIGLMNIMKLFSKLKKTHMVLEVEEIYSDVYCNSNLKRKELKYFQLADAYIFPTQLLDYMVNIHHKPSVFIHGTYQVEPERKCDIFNKKLQNENNKIIHCVYAGTLDPRKGGAIAAATAAEFLPNNYHIHILGFGSDEVIQSTKDAVSGIASRSKAKVTYDGCLSGEDYIRFIQGCDIGFSTQNPDAAFNATSFPSKILSYMANGLRVVSIRIPAIEKSAIGDYMYYYDKQTPEEIAKTILSVDMSKKYDSRKIIDNLDLSFQNDLKELLKNG